MEKSKKCFIIFCALWLVTILFLWITPDQEGIASNLIVYWIIQPLAIVVLSAVIIADNTSQTKWLYPISFCVMYALIPTVTSSIKTAIEANTFNSFIWINWKMLRNGILFSFLGSLIGVVIRKTKKSAT